MEEVEEHHRNLSFCNKKHSSSECNVDRTVLNACNDSLCLTCMKCLINDVHDECVSKYVNEMLEQNDALDKSSARSRYFGKLIKKIRYPTSNKMPRDYLKYCAWKPTGREFTLKDGKLIVVQSEQTETFYE